MKISSLQIIEKIPDNIRFLKKNRIHIGPIVLNGLNDRNSVFLVCENANWFMPICKGTPEYLFLKILTDEKRYSVRKINSVKKYLRYNNSDDLLILLKILNDETLNHLTNSKKIDISCTIEEFAFYSSVLLTDSCYQKFVNSNTQLNFDSYTVENLQKLRSRILLFEYE